eukprot:TRINITY_DN21761_c0_g1_i2.p1 TRINITY_DN21761_c0_g1~~TRINITY_DN21761_c0_g1_i2.p1  ORF type:complete len:289 (+),score=38.41 TRINITY_DN21761_c0_g1_i2:49-915(+)
MIMFALDGTEVELSDIKETHSVAEVLRRLGGKGTYLVADGRRLSETETLEGFEEVVIGQDVTSCTNISSRQWSSVSQAKGPTELKTELHDYVTDRELLDLNHFMRWLLQYDVVSMTNSILTERDELNSPDINLEERLHALHPIPDEKLSLLMDMGFSEELCRKVLWQQGLDIQRSLHALLDAETIDTTISRAEYREITRVCSELGEASIHDEDGYRPESRSQVSCAIEQAIYKYTDIPGDEIRDAMLGLVQNPQAIFKYIDHPTLAPFFECIREKGPNELQLLQSQCF